MYGEEPFRRKTRSQLVDEQKEASRPQIHSQNNIDAPQHNSDIDSSKIKQHKQLPRKSNWIKKQKVKYLVFLNYYSLIPYWGSDLKSIPTYKSLSQFVKSRSPQQCKSFHLSTRRNFKSIDEEIKALQEELELEEGYQKMLDRYELQIIGFEEEYQILKAFDLEEKSYFHNKFVQTCKQTGFNKKELNISGDSPQEIEHDYNPKINIKDLIKEKEVQQKRYQEIPPHFDTYQPLINMHYDKFQQENYHKGMVSGRPSNQKTPMMMSNPQHSGMGFYAPEHSFHPIESSKMNDQSRIENMRNNSQGSAFGTKTMPNPSNERMMHQNMHRMADPSRNVYSQYPNYGPYGSSPFGGMNQMHMPQYRNQMPYSMPPQGALPYMMSGYSEPYGMGILPPRYENQTEKSQNRNDPESIQSLSSEKGRAQKNDSIEQRAFSEKKKQLLLACTEHYVNWFRAVQQISKRKQMGINLVGQ